MIVPEPPIIIAEGLDVAFYDEVDEAESDLEAIDVRHSIFVGYDSKARPLTFSIERRHERRFFNLIGVSFDAVIIEVASGAPSREEELRGLLIKFLVALGKNIDVERMEHWTLPEILRTAMEITGTR